MPNMKPVSFRMPCCDSMNSVSPRFFTEIFGKTTPGGNFLTQKHTRQHMREIFLPQFMDRRPYTEWETKKDDARDWALEKARKTLASHQPDPLDEKVSAEMAKIIAALE